MLVLLQVVPHQTTHVYGISLPHTLKYIEIPIGILETIFRQDNWLSCYYSTSRTTLGEITI
jgi:hypothetical protein